MIIKPIDNNIQRVDAPLKRTKSSQHFEEAITDAIEIDIVHVTSSDDEESKENKNPQHKNLEDKNKKQSLLDIKA